MFHAAAKSVARQSLRSLRSVHAVHARSQSSLTARMAQLIPDRVAYVADVRKKLDNAQLDTVTVQQAYMGMRDITCMVYEPSLLDAQEGIRFRGLSIPEVQAQLPAADTEPLPEALLWLLMTGEVPTVEQTQGLTAEFQKRAALPEDVVRAVDAFPADRMHPMSQLVAGSALLNVDSTFAQGYANGTLSKPDYWKATLEDSIDLLAKLPALAARIYRNTYHNGQHIAADDSLDWGANFAHMLGYDGKDMYELMRLYLVLHSDHEGGNVSAHTAHLVNSALADPYLSFAASMSGLAGPLHGLANQECLKFIHNMKAALGDRPVTEETITEEVWRVLNSKKVVPGYGHAVLRQTDPRFEAQRAFAEKTDGLKDDEYVRIVATMYKVVPGILTEHGKTKNPFPNVDAHSGVLLQHYGLKEAEFYTVLFGVSRAIGVLTNMTWARAYGMALERPKSVTTEWIEENIKA